MHYGSLRNRLSNIAASRTCTIDSLSNNLSNIVQPLGHALCSSLSNSLSNMAAQDVHLLDLLLKVTVSVTFAAVVLQNASRSQLQARTSRT